MIYIVNLLISCVYLCFVRINSWREFLPKLFLVFLIWVLIIGGQNGIGTDYNNYLYYFESPHENRFEPLFTYISQTLYDIGLKGQAQFFFFAFVNVVVLFIAAVKLDLKHLSLFFNLMVTVSTFYNNQMNGIRQCVAVPIVFWGFIEMYSNRIKGACLILLAAGFHYSALVCLLFIYIKPITNWLTRNPHVLLLLTICSCFIESSSDLNYRVIQSLPDFIRENTSYERMYSNADYTSASTDIIYKLSKLIYVPVYWCSLRLLMIGDLTKREEFFFKFGFLSFNLRCILLVNNLLGRLSYYFWIPSILPIYYLCRKFIIEKKYLYVIVLLVYCSVTYVAKVIIGANEYKSSFIYFDLLFP